jgi:hypothetical protein
MEIRNCEITNLAISASTAAPPPVNTCGPTNNGIYPNETVTGSLTGGSVWGTNSYGYTDDSDFNRAVVHAGLATVGQTVTITKTSVGTKDAYPSTTENGITTTAYTYPWCGVTIALA